MSTAMPAQARKPTTGYAPVNGVNMYYEIHGSGSGAPLVLLHGSYMTISNNWTGWIGELSKARTIIAVEMQGHGRTADIGRVADQASRSCASRSCIERVTGRP